jgi:hypothetical protein
MEPQQCDSVCETLSDSRTIAQVFRRRLTGNAMSQALQALDGVGGRVFTRRIEHTFEWTMFRMGLKVLL